MPRNPNDTPDPGHPPATPPARPTVLYPSVDWYKAAPKPLRDLDQWVSWKFQLADPSSRAAAGKADKWTKVPYRSKNPEYPASHAKRISWARFDDAVSSWLNRSRNGVDGIGCVFSESDEFAGIDFDKCLDAEGNLYPWAAEYLNALLPTYAEISPSGTGIKVWVRGILPGHGTKRTGYGPTGEGAIEVYDRLRFFTVTGNIYGGSCDPQSRPEALAEIYREVMSRPQSRRAGSEAESVKPRASRANAKAGRPADHSDDALIAKARAAKNGPEFVALFDRGDISAYVGRDGQPDASSADMALANIIAFWTGPDAARIEAMFGRSALAQRDKWRTRADYRSWTVDRAVSDLKDHYQANRVGRPGPSPSIHGPHPSPPGEGGEGDRMEIEITPEEHEVIGLAAVAIARDPGVFQRCNTLVRVLRDTASCKMVHRAPGLPRIATLQAPTIREKLAKNAAWITYRMAKEGDGELEKVSAHPPGWAVSGVSARGEWDHVRPIEAVIESPIFRPDGTIFASPGYDAQTGILFEPSSSIRWPAILDAPTHDHAREAAARLLNIVAEFPFQAEVHRIVWLAGLLTPVARYAIDGPCPLFLFDANAPGSGKSLLSDIIAVIATGRAMPRTVYPSDDDEMRKRITSIAMAGDRLMLLDNIATMFGGSTFDAAIAARTWNDRLLGKSEMAGEMSLNVVWYGTGNNVSLRGDALRRVMPCRLETKEEKPEKRRGFRYPNLLAWVGSERVRFVSDALTILRAYHVEGRPRTFQDELGTFEAWSDLVRGAVAWATGIDPCDAQEEMQSSDPEVSAATAVLDGWAELPMVPVWKSAAMVHQLVKDYPDRFEQLRAGLLEWSRTDDLPTPRQIGMRLKAIKGRVLAGKYLEAKAHSGTLQWTVSEGHAAAAATNNTNGHATGGAIPPKLSVDSESESVGVGPASEGDGDDDPAWC